MSALSRIVRPYQLRDSTPPRRILDPTEQTKPNIVLSVGKGGSPKTLNGSVSFSWRGYMKKRVKEKRTGG